MDTAPQSFQLDVVQRLARMETLLVEHKEDHTETLKDIAAHDGRIAKLEVWRTRALVAVLAVGITAFGKYAVPLLPLFNLIGMP